MTQEKIEYHEVIALGFTEEVCSDKTYYNQYGYDYCIIQLNLTKKIYIDWAKETQLCELVRIDSPKRCNIKARMPINNLNHLKEIINFFSDQKEQNCDYSTVA